MKRPGQLFNCYLPSFRALPSPLHLSGHESVSLWRYCPLAEAMIFLVYLVFNLVDSFDHYPRTMIHRSHEKQNARNIFVEKERLSI